MKRFLSLFTLTLSPDWLWLLPVTVYLTFFHVCSQGVMMFDQSELVCVFVCAQISSQFQPNTLYTAYKSESDSLLQNVMGDSESPATFLGTPH